MRRRNRKQGQEAFAGAQAELKQTRAALQQAESVAADLRARADASARGASETREALQSKLAEAEAGARDLQARLDAAARAIKAKQADLVENETALQAAKARAGALEEQNRKLEALRVENSANASPTADPAVQARLKEQEAAIADLQGRLEAATVAARNAADDIAAAVARLDQLEERNRKLKARLAETEGAEARLAETTALLEAARTELAHLSAAQTVAPARVKASEQPTPETAAPEPVVEAPGVIVETATPAAESAESADQPAEPPPPPAPSETPVAGDLIAPEPTPATLESPVEEATAPAPTTEESAKRKPAKAGRPKKERRDGQLDFFGETVVGPTGDQATEDAGVSAQAPGEPVLLVEEPSSAPEPAPDEAKSPRAPRSTPPINLGQLRKAINQIMPLFAGQDPGAKDCLQDNRATFRSAFSPEAYPDFEQAVKAGEFSSAIEQLKKAARRHGISV